MILIAFGANLPSPHGTPADTCRKALDLLEERGIRIAARSRLWESAPVPVSDQPWFINGVARVETGLNPDALLKILHAVEAEFGRIRVKRNEARVLDLDLIDYEGQTSENPMLPHPRMTERAFVLRPLAEVAPDWTHPVTGQGIDALIAALPNDQTCRPMG